MSSGEKNKKVLIVCQHFWPESFRINDITEYLIDENCEVDVLCGRPNYPSGTLMKGYTLWNKGIENYKGAVVYRSFEIPRGSNTNVRIFLNYISFPIFSIFHIPRFALKKYDQILIYQLSPVMMSFAGLIIGKLQKTQTTMYVLDLWPENLFSVLDIKQPLLRILVTKISHWHYKKSDKLIALSATMKRRLIDVTGKSQNEVIVLPQACEKLYEKPIHSKKLHKRFSSTFNVVFTGNISPAQSFDTIITAADIIRRNGISDIKWIIVGDGMSRESVEKKVAEKGLTDYFSFEGSHPIEDMPKYTELADILVGCLVKSDLLEATIPAKVMSYIASGKPLVLAMDGDVQALINNEIKCGFASNTEDAEAFAGNILQLYRMTPSKRAALGARAQRYHFTHLERNLILGKLYKFMFHD